MDRPDLSKPGRARGVVVVLVLVALVAATGIALRLTGPASSVKATPSLPAGSVGPGSLPADASYDAVFPGDPTGKEDVGAALATFLESHDGQHVALARDATYLVSQVGFKARNLTVDFRGATIQASQRGVHGIVVIHASTGVVLNDPSIVGTGFAWSGGDTNPDQWEHGIEIDGGSNITINHPKTRTVRGDGIYIGYQAGVTKPATSVAITNPDIEHSSRNGIAPVAGEVSIVGGHIFDSGLHGVDFEPNDEEGARSIVGTVDGVEIRRVQGLDVGGLKGYAVATAAPISTQRAWLLVQHLTGDELRMAIWDTTVAIVRDNVSDRSAVVEFPGCDTVVFSNNAFMTRR